MLNHLLNNLTSLSTQVYGWPQLNFSLNAMLLFSSLIVAVDPVAVLAIFQDIGVDQELYFIVFGESLFNDAVTVVIYEIMKAFMGVSTISSFDIGIGIISFFTVSLGGALIGTVIGVLSCLATRIETNTEVVTLLLFAYISYVLADTIKWSGIIAIICCGMVQAEYAFFNITPESVLVLRKVVEICANLCEGIIFLFLGESLVNMEKGWHTGFVLWSLSICFVSRFIFTVALSWVNNWINLENRFITWTEMLILTYGGLRGAVAFSLAKLINEKDMTGSNTAEKELNTEILRTATLFVILFTVAVHGLTMKPLVKILNIKKKEEENLSLFKATAISVVDNLLPAIEGICGDLGENSVREKIVRANNRYIRPLLQKNINNSDQSFMRVLEKISLAMHYAMIKPMESSSFLQELPERLRDNGTCIHMGSFVNVNDAKTGKLTTLAKLSSKVSDCDEVDKDTFHMALAKTHRRSVMMPDYKQKQPSLYYKDMHTILKHKSQVLECNQHSKLIAKLSIPTGPSTSQAHKKLQPIQNVPETGDVKFSVNEEIV